MVQLLKLQTKTEQEGDWKGSSLESHTGTKDMRRKIMLVQISGAVKKTSGFQGKEHKLKSFKLVVI